MERFFRWFFLVLLLLPRIAFTGDRSSVSGIVSDPTSRPIQGASIVLREVKENSSEKPKEHKTGSDSKGTFNLSNVEAGIYEIRCEKAGYHTEKKMVSLAPGEPRTISFLLIPDALSGEVTHFGKVDMKTARVFVTFTSMELKTDKPASTEPSSPDLPYSTLPEMGAILYGGSPSNEMPFPKLDPSAGASSVLTSLHQNNVSLMDTKTHQIVASLPTAASPLWIAFSRDGRRFWTVDSMHNLVMYDSSGELKNSVNIGENIVADFTVGENRLYLAVRTWPRPMVMLADAFSNALVGNILLPVGRGQPGGIATSKDERTLFVTMGTNNKGWLEIIDLSSGQVSGEIEVGAQPMGVGVTPDRRAIVANYSSASVDVIDLVNLKILSHLPTGIQPARVRVRPDGRMAFVTNNGDHSVSVIDMTAATLAAKVQVGKGPMGLAVSPDGSKVYVANHDSANVTTLDGFTYAVLGTTIESRGSQVFDVAVRP